MKPQERRKEREADLRAPVLAGSLTVPFQTLPGPPVSQGSQPGLVSPGAAAAADLSPNQKRDRECPAQAPGDLRLHLSPMIRQARSPV